MTESGNNRKPAKPGGEDRKKPGAGQRGGGLRAVARSLAAVTKPLLKGRSRAETGLILDWPDAVGAKIAGLCRPLSVTFPHRGQRDGGVLLLQVASGRGPEVQHLEPQILQRVNGYLGYPAIERIRIKQTVGPARPGAGASTPSKKALGEIEDKDDQDLVTGLEEEPQNQLHKALLDLARARERAKQRKD